MEHTDEKKGYSRHPEVLRWRGRLKALYLRHERLVAEMGKRGYMHESHLDIKFAKGAARLRKFVDPYNERVRKLRAKKCKCRV